MLHNNQKLRIIEAFVFFASLMAPTQGGIEGLECEGIYLIAIFNFTATCL